MIQTQAPEFAGQALSGGAGQPPMFHLQCDIFLGLLLARVVDCLEMSLCGGSKWTRSCVLAFSGLSVWAAQLPKPKLQLRASASGQKHKWLTARKVEEKQVPMNPTVV